MTALQDRPSPPETAALLAAGKLEQVCPKCDRREAAGHFCSGCYRRTGPADWRPTVRSEAQRAASSLSGRRRGFRGVVTEKTAKPAVVAPSGGLL